MMPHEGDAEDKCLFHTEQEKDSDAFMAAFIERVQQGGDQGVDATRFVFPAFTLPRGFEFPGPVNFRHATFTQYTAFRDATFTKETNFRYTTFKDADFQGATFTKDADFWGATFTRGADFWDTTFTHNAIFLGATFTQNALFLGATFTQDVIFSGATFAGEAIFTRAIIMGTVVFERASFAGLLDWTGAVVLPGACIVLRGATVGGELRLQDVQTPDVDFEESWRRLLAARAERVCPLGLHPTKMAEGTSVARVDLRNLSLDRDARVRLLGIRGGRASGVEDAVKKLEDDPGFAGEELETAWQAVLQSEDTRRRLDATKYRFAHSEVERFHFQNVAWRQPRAWQTRLGAWWRQRFGDHGIERVLDEDFIRYLPGKRNRSRPEEHEALSAGIVADVYRGIRAS